jgi:anthranilate phosphoribosyltransferase
MDAQRKQKEKDMPTYQANPTDVGQDKRESSQFDGGVPVFNDAKTRMVPQGANTAPQMIANAGSSIRNNAGVMMSASDTPGRMVEELQGKA